MILIDRNYRLDLDENEMQIALDALIDIAVRHPGFKAREALIDKWKEAMRLPYP